MNEQEKVEKVGTFRSAAAGFIQMFETYWIDLEKVAAELALDRQKLNAREKDIIERECKVGRRENEVGQIRQIAADRKIQMEVAQDAAAKADKMRRNAEAETRLAKKERRDMEVVLAKLLQEKNELAAAVAAVPQLQFIKDNAAPVAEAVKEDLPVIVLKET
jgi:hypothetical protein